MITGCVERSTDVGEQGFGSGDGQVGPGGNTGIFFITISLLIINTGYFSLCILLLLITNIHKGNLHSALNSTRNYAGGFRWSYNIKPNELIPPKKRIYNKTGKQKNPSNHKVIISMQIIQCDLEGNEIHTWNSRNEIQENLDISSQMINHVVNGRSKNKDGEYKGFIWKKGKQLTNVVYKYK